MAGKYADIAELARYIMGLGKGIEQGTLKALLATATSAEASAKMNSIKQFTGRNDRTLGGNLLNNIFSGLEDGDGRFPDIFVGVRSIPYAAVHEFGSDALPGGAIKPKSTNKLQKLWVPKYANAGKMTPREFFVLLERNPKMYHFNRGGPGRAGLAARVSGSTKKGQKPTLIPLFFLVDEVKIPKRPYLVPALEAAVTRFPSYLSKYLEGEG